MTITISSLQPVIALAAGVLILIVPRLLNFIVAIYLILIGLIGLGMVAVSSWCFLAAFGRGAGELIGAGAFELHKNRCFARCAGG